MFYGDPERWPGLRTIRNKTVMEVRPEDLDAVTKRLDRASGDAGTLASRITERIGSRAVIEREEEESEEPTEPV